MAIYESRVWVGAVPILSVRLHLDDDTICVAVRLRIGASLCSLHLCYHCAQIDHLAMHSQFELLLE